MYVKNLHKVQIIALETKNHPLLLLIFKTHMTENVNIIISAILSTDISFH